MRRGAAADQRAVLEPRQPRRFARRPARGQRVEQRRKDDLAVSERRPGSARVSEQRLGHHADRRAAEHHRRRRLSAERRHQRREVLAEVARALRVVVVNVADGEADHVGPLAVERGLQRADRVALEHQVEQRHAVPGAFGRLGHQARADRHHRRRVPVAVGGNHQSLHALLFHSAGTRVPIPPPRKAGRRALRPPSVQDPTSLITNQRPAPVIHAQAGEALQSQRAPPSPSGDLPTRRDNEVQLRRRSRQE